MQTRARQPEARSAHQQLQRLLQRPFDLWPPDEPFTPWSDGLAPNAAPFEPLADIEEAEDAFIIEIELPGISRSDIQVEHAGRRITVCAERREPDRQGVLRHRSRFVGHLRYELELPSDTTDAGVGAALADGVLTVRVPKLNPDTPRHIPVA